MKVLLAGEIDAVWRRELATAMPEATWLDAGEADAALVANPAPGALAGQPRLRLIQSLWAGVDRLLADPTLPAGVPITRMVDPAMSAAMAETALWATLSLHRGFFAYAQAQREAVWRVHAQRRADEVGVLVLGQGEMGRAAATRIAQQGYPVRAWRRSRRHDDTPLPALLADAAIVINLLPLTAETRGLLDAGFFARMAPRSAIVNLGRGAHLVEADLLDALDRGHLRHAVLDVFQTEPLPAVHAFWRHPSVTVLPHAAALTDARSASVVAAANLRAARDGQPLAHRVDRARGY